MRKAVGFVKSLTKSQLYALLEFNMYFFSTWHIGGSKCQDA